MQVKMLSGPWDIRPARDLSPVRVNEGETHDFPDRLAASLVERGLAEAVAEVAAPLAPPPKGKRGAAEPAETPAADAAN